MNTNPSMLLNSFLNWLKVRLPATCSSVSDRSWTTYAYYSSCKHKECPIFFPCTQTLHLGTALPQFVWHVDMFQVHIHILNPSRSKSEDKLLNPAASKLSACGGTTRAGGCSISGKCQTPTPTHF